MSLVIVFLSGMVVMSLEILASRVLAPIVGTTVLVWSTIIGVILLGISIGYYLGGVIADRKTNTQILFLVIFISAFFSLLIVPLKNILGGMLLEGFLAFLALFYSLALFLGPATFLGIITTYTIRLETKSIKEVGRINGLLYGASTLGSVFGVYLTGYYLIPNYTLTAIFYFLSGCLFIASFLTFLISGKGVSAISIR